MRLLGVALFLVLCIYGDASGVQVKVSGVVIFEICCCFLS